jgi:hypothetical protein
MTVSSYNNLFERESSKILYLSFLKRLENKYFIPVSKSNSKASAYELLRDATLSSCFPAQSQPIEETSPIVNLEQSSSLRSSNYQDQVSSKPWPKNFKFPESRIKPDLKLCLDRQAKLSSN